MILFLASHCAREAPALTSAQLEVALEDAKEVYDSEGSKAALPLFQSLLGDFNRSADKLGEASVLGYIGNCHKHLGEYDEALEYLQESLHLRKQFGDPVEKAKGLNLIGLVYWDLADYKEARRYFVPALEIARTSKDQVLEATVLNNLALLADEEGDYRSSRELYKSALKLFQALDDASGKNVVLANIGGVHLLTGEFSAAAEYYDEALQISREEGWKPTESVDLGNLAHCYLGMGQTEAALKALDEALVLAQQAGIRKEEADWHRGKGSLYLRTGRYADALQQYSTALSIYAEAGLKAERLQALIELGDLHLLLGDPAQAEHTLLEALDLAQEIQSPRGQVLALITLGDLRSRLTLQNKAIALYRAALEIAERMEDPFNASEALVRIAQVQESQGDPQKATLNAERALETLRETGASYAVANTKHILAGLYRELGRFDEAQELHSQLQESSLINQDPELAWREALSRGLTFETVQEKKAALSSFQSAIETIESVRSRLGEKGLHEGYLIDRSQPYLELTRLSLELGLTEKAFLNSERLRAQSYSDLVVEDSSLAYEGPQKQKVFEFRERVRQLRNSIKEERGLPPDGQRPQAVAYLLDKLERAELEYGEFLQTLALADPEYERILNVSVPSLDAMMARILSDAALVEYLVGPDECYAFVLTGSGLQVASIPLARRDLVTRVELFRDLVQREDSSAWKGPGQKLHELLIRPLEEAGWLSQVSKLFIVPHEVLHYLPFSALGPDSEGQFLIERYLIASVPSASSLLPHSRQEAPKSLLAMAPERPMLQFATAEVAGIAQSFPSPMQLLLGKAASESEFKSHAFDYQVLHFATHATFNQWNPLLSALELEPGEDEDGNLTVLEILALDLQADLVTLSACETGIAGGQFSNLPPGDDFVGLTRAFQFAGGREVLATLWEVDDQATSETMTRFYAERKESDSVRALAKVQRRMLGQKDALSHPRHWAPFIIVETSPSDSQRK